MPDFTGHRDDPILGLTLSRSGPEPAWVPVDSSWVHSYRRRGNTLQVRYKDKKTGVVTVTCQYADPDGTLYAGMASAASKGKFVHASLYHLPYTLV